MTAREDVSLLNAVLDDFRKMAMFESYEIDSPESPGMDGDTPLHIAALQGDVNAVKVFLPHVKNVNVTGGIGNTPLHYAVTRNHLKVAQMLLKNGADINFKNDYDDSPADLMVGKADFDELIFLEQ
ncbi:ankyrin repeat domain-containing protein [Xanthomonas axonopodis pv. begoniae]|nr:ankyrin repeat domain-containing protein [Xanthomonas axonopodis pv. begoniae]MBO9773177.1 ankyrin repeat domain-containing protein [Xanthomonas axonopodis pv. begoniae]PPT37304.1 hypothetical protein XabCFBP2524_08245 [Xanthomonas axonopodis pv. begoniae]